MSQKCIKSFRGRYAFLSNFSVCKHAFIYKGLQFRTSEAAYQAAKTDDLSERKKIAGMSAQKAKAYGHKIIMISNWDKIKVQNMEEILEIKFSSEILMQKLVNTGNRVIVEGNTWNDTFWGKCNGIGQNHLGELLMQQREKCKSKLDQLFKNKLQDVVDKK